jgi:outer membrane protein
MAAFVTLLVVLGACAVEAQTADWMLGGRGLYVAAATESSLLGETDSRLELDAGGGFDLHATLDIFDRLAAQVSVGASSHRLEAVTAGSCCGGGSGGERVDGGRVWLVPVSLLLQYHHPVYGEWDPYVGLGVVWTYPVYDLSRELEAAGVERLDFDGGAGFAAQIGANYALDTHWRASVDLRYLGVSLDARVRTAEGDLEPVSLDANPWVFGLGFAYRF